MIEHVFPPEMMYEREKQLILSLSDCAGSYYDINFTQNRVLGTPIQFIGGVPYPIHKQIGLPEHCAYTDVIQYWGRRLDPRDQPAFFDFFDIQRIMACYARGERLITHRYWTKNILGEPMLAVQKIRLYTDTVTGDLLGLTYVSDDKAFVALQQQEAQLAEQYESAANRADFLEVMSVNIPGGYHRCGIGEGFPLEFVSDSFLEIVGYTREQLARELARIEQGKDEVNAQPLDLYEHGRNLYEMFAGEMQAAGIQFRAEGDALHDRVLCDSLKLTRILMNMLSNAKKFTPAGGTVSFGGIRLSSEDHQNTYRFFVRDTGIGMSEEFQRRAFQQFEQERSSTASGVAGSGLGLAIIKKLVELMGGTVSIESQLGVGTEISATLTLPLAEEAQPEPIVLSARLPDMTGKRVLLVEDNDFNREITRYILEGLHFQVEEAENGAVAVDKLLHSAPGHFSLVLMDIQMPVMDGYTATKEIRAIPDAALSAIPILAMTANAFDEDKQRCLRVGMNGHIAKPIHQESFLKELSKVLL